MATVTSERGWRPRGAAGRVRLAHEDARAGLRLTLVFFAAAAVSAAIPHNTGRWLPLHLGLAGGVVLAISTVSVYLTVTWSAAPAPSRAVTRVQRALVAAGAAGLAAARGLSWPAAIAGLAGVSLAAGLAALAAILVTVVRRGPERRFDPAVAWYLAAVGAGLCAAALGASLAGVGPAATSGTRSAHVALNLLGLVGLVVAGTLPYFAATLVRARMSRRATPRALAALLAWQAGALAAAAVALARGAEDPAVVALAAYAAGIVAVATAMPPPTRRQLAWAGPRLVALWAGIGWWIAAVAAGALGVARGESLFAGRSLLVLVLGGYAQIVWASLAYLGPVLRGGGHERLAAGFRTTRSWTGLAALNAMALSLAAGRPLVAAVAATVVAGDAGVRAARLAAEAR